MTRVVLVPGVLALLPEYAGLEDPVADLRAACVDAVRWLGDGFGIHGSSQGLRVVQHLAAEAGVQPDLAPERPDGVVVVANGSATRTEKAPGHLDPRAVEFDDGLGAALRAGDLSALHVDLAPALWADVDGLRWLRDEIDLDPATTRTDYDDDPFGVQYWVMRWEGQWR
jgi:hypothetical protein